MNTQALQRITTIKQPRLGETGEHILANKRKAKTTAALAAEVERKKRAAALAGMTPEARHWLDVLAGRAV